MDNNNLSEALTNTNGKEETNIYRLSDIEEAYGINHSEALNARNLLFYIERNMEELETVLANDKAELLLKFCIGFFQQNKNLQ